MHNILCSVWFKSVNAPIPRKAFFKYFTVSKKIWPLWVAEAKKWRGEKSKKIIDEDFSALTETNFDWIVGAEVKRDPQIGSLNFLGSLRSRNYKP